MNTRRELADDFCRVSVPPEATVPLWQIVVVIVGIGITLPIFFLGAELAQTVGLGTAVAAFFAGCLPLGIIGAITGYIGASTRMSSYLIVQFAFGRTGGKLINLLMAIALIGYFGATADSFGRALSSAAAEVLDTNVPPALVTVVGSAAMTLTAIYGFKAIDRLSMLSMPLMCGVLLYAVFLALKATGWELERDASGFSPELFGYATSAVFGSCIQGAVLLPDVTRFARSPLAGAIAVLGICVGYPLIFLVAAVCSVAMGQTDIMRIMIGLGIGIPALVTLVFATWTTNTINIYSTSLTASLVFTRSRPLVLILLASVFGTLVAVAGIMDHFIPFVTVLGVTIPPVAGVFIVDYFLVRRRNYDPAQLASGTPGELNWPAMLGWGLGAGAGVAANAGFWGLTGLPGLDSLALAAASYGLLMFAPRIGVTTRRRLLREDAV